MCGIAGFYSFGEPQAPALLKKMNDAITHRGPDDFGYWGKSAEGVTRAWKETAPDFRLQVGLGMRRLSILDLSPTGHQPMTTPDGRYWITFNGEIYNYIELREEFPDYPFKGTSDTEVLLCLFAKFGIEGLSKLNGMFTFAVYDTQDEVLWIVRDPIGIKPLYYTEQNKTLCFGSEIRAILPAFTEKPSLNLPLVSRYLQTNWIPDPDTLYAGIHKLEPGHLLKVTSQGISKHCFWEYKFQPDEGKSLKYWEEELDGALNRSVRRQMRSDVPVAFFLSGGVDSSLLAAKGVDAHITHRPSTFTIGFQWAKSKEDNLDLNCARLLKEHYPLDYREIILEPSVVNLLPKIVDTLEEPIADPAALCSYLICEAASKEFKVLISGQGGDEIFGGYHVYFGGWLAKTLQTAPKSVLKLMDNLLGRVPYAFGKRRVQSVHRLQKLLFSAQSSWPDPFFILRSAILSKEVEPMLTSATASVQNDPFARHHEHYSQAKQWDTIQQMLYLDTKTYLPSTNLTYTDKTSMAHSVEVRVPFLDHEIVNLLARVPSRYKSEWHKAKILLKLFAEQTLPRELIYRKKTGFGIPLRDWLLKDLQPMAEDLLGESRIRKQNLFQPAVLANYLKEHRNKVADHSAKIYSLMTLQLWMERNEVSI